MRGLNLLEEQLCEFLHAEHVPGAFKILSRSCRLDHIVEVVREGQTRRAPIERVADLLIGYFVPVVTLLAIITWVIWLSLGSSGALPRDFLDISIGGWGKLGNSSEKYHTKTKCPIHSGMVIRVRNCCLCCCLSLRYWSSGSDSITRRKRTRS